jgi:hypothetical protein
MFKLPTAVTTASKVGLPSGDGFLSAHWCARRVPVVSILTWSIYPPADFDSRAFTGSRRGRAFFCRYPACSLWRQSSLGTAVQIMGANSSSRCTRPCLKRLPRGSAEVRTARKNVGRYARIWATAARRRRRSAIPAMPMPPIIMPHVAGSGTAAVAVTDFSLKPSASPSMAV